MVFGHIFGKGTWIVRTREKGQTERKGEKFPCVTHTDETESDAGLANNKDREEAG